MCLICVCVLLLFPIHPITLRHYLCVSHPRHSLALAHSLSAWRPISVGREAWRPFYPIDRHSTRFRNGLLSTPRLSTSTCSSQSEHTNEWRWRENRRNPNFPSQYTRNFCPLGPETAKQFPSILGLRLVKNYVMAPN
nr:hypothetical protein C37A5.10 - Caenorhabditis elegans [Caenorhabditis elegans]